MNSAIWLSQTSEAAMLRSCENLTAYLDPMPPMRAGMTRHPSAYRWSSFTVNAQGERSDLIVPHEQYQALGRSSDERREAYCELFRAKLDPDVVMAIRGATNGNIALGGSRFQVDVETALGRRARRGKSGRPPAHGRDKPWSVPY
jgi:putative transposase